jgi:hypothetical protein
MPRQTINNTRYDWPIGCGPATYVDRSVVIGVCRVIARYTPKLVLGLAVFFGYMPAFGALPAGIARVNSDQRYASKGGLVRQEQPELRKRPGVQNCPLLAPGLDSITNARQFFDGQPAIRAFSFSNDLLGNVVVYAGSEPSFFACEFLQPALGRSGLQLLKLSPKFPVAKADAFNFSAGVPRSVRGRSYLGNPEIHPEKLNRVDGGVARQIDRAVQVELSFPVDQISLTLNPVKPLLLVLAIDQRDHDPALRESPQAHTINTPESHYPFVVSDRAMRLEDRANLFVAPETLYRLTYGANSHLSRQAETVTYFPIGEFVYRRLAEYTGVEPGASRKRRGFIKALHSFKQPHALFGVGQKL